MKITGIQCFKERKGEGMPLEEAYLEAKVGLRGDAYADGSEKQLVVMDAAALKKDPEGEPRGFCREKFKANIMIEGLGEHKLKVGMLLQLGQTCVRLTNIKGCYELCERITSKLSCPLRGAAAFGVIEEGGKIELGDEVKLSQ